MAKKIAVFLLGALMCLMPCAPAWAETYDMSWRDTGMSENVYSDQMSIIDLDQAVAILKKDGSLWSWGKNSYGQIGNGRGFQEYYDSSKSKWVKPFVDTPYRILDNVSKIHGEAHWVIKNDNTLWVWGKTAVALGLASDAATAKPQKYMDNVKDFSISQDPSGEFIYYVVKTDNTLWGWGKNSYGELGDGTTIAKTSPTLLMNDVISAQYAVGYEVSPKQPYGATFVVKTDGTLWMWGADIEKMNGMTEQGSVISTPIKVMNDVKYVRNHDDTIAVVTTSGELYVWGELPGLVDGGYVINYSFSSSTGSSDLKGYYISQPYHLATQVREAYLQGGHIAYVTNGGDAYVWLTGSAPQMVGSEIKTMAVRYTFYFMCKTNGDLLVYGNSNNYPGVLGTKESSVTSAKKVLTDVAQVYATRYTSFAVKNDGTVWGTGGDVEHLLMGKGTQYSFVKLTDGAKVTATPSTPVNNTTPVVNPTPENSTTPTTNTPTTTVNVTVRGVAVKWTDAAPYVDKNNRTMVPLRAVGDALGLMVSWDGVNKEAVFSNGVKTLYFPIDKNYARTSDGKTIMMDTAAVVINGRTYAPIRYLAEYFGYTVDWDNATRTVIIK